MRLRDLKAKFYRLGTPDGRLLRPTRFLAKAHGVQFLCPKCFLANGGEVGTHSVMCYFAGRGVPDDVQPGPGRWNPSGSGLDDLTFVPPGSTSVLLTSGCHWHGFIVNGDASIL